MFRRLVIGGLGILFLLGPKTAVADPCKAIPDSGPTPASLAFGAVFSGPVVYVGDGDSFCTAAGPEPATWIEVRIADFYAPELNEPGGYVAKLALARIAMGKRARCIAQHRSHDRIVANCSIDGRSIGDLLRAEGIREGGNGRTGVP